MYKVLRMIPGNHKFSVFVVIISFFALSDNLLTSNLPKYLALAGHREGPEYLMTWKRM